MATQYDPIVTSQNIASLLPAARTQQVMPPTAVPASSGGIYSGVWNNPALYSQTGPGGGNLSAITPVSVSGAANAYPSADQWLMAAAKPAGQSFETSMYGGDTGSFTIGGNNPVRVTDLSGNVLYEGTGYEGAQAAANLTSDIVANTGSTGYRIEGYDPYSGDWQNLSYNAPSQDGLGMLADIALPVAGSILLPGIGTGLSAALAGGLGAAAGSALSSVAQGRGIEDLALRAALAGGAAYGGNVLGQSLGAAGDVGTSAATGAGGGASAGAGSVGADVINVVANPLPGILSPIAAAVPGVATSLPDSILNNQPTIRPSNVTEDQIIVEGPRAQPIPITGEVAGNLASVAAPVVADTLPDSILGDQPTVEDTSGGLLNDIMKYYTLGAFGLDTLGNLMGGSGSAATTTPYVSQLGAMPTFARGGFTPYTGDYETYGFGPEFNFFGGAPATTMGPQASLLNPELPVNNTVVA